MLLFFLPLDSYRCCAATANIVSAVLNFDDYDRAVIIANSARQIVVRTCSNNFVRELEKILDVQHLAKLRPVVSARGSGGVRFDA